ncbi:hypothetical protein ACHAL6_10830 [Proteiniclasticum sp. C24MP]|uniref:hypothetical protein n=1 Tax=Proteiniclasticum sp. C24MP TaxID=3374101 RepID=UPI0037549DD3
MKYFLAWIGLSTAVGFLLYIIVSVMTRVTFGNIFHEFEIMLMLIGFSAVLSTVTVCTKILTDKLNAMK